MTYILTADRDPDEPPDAPFARYQAYVASVREKFPPGALSLVTSDWYFDIGDVRSPHDASLEAVTVAEASDPVGEPDASRSVRITIRLLGARHDGHIELRYHDVRRYRIEFQPRDPDDRWAGHRDWRHDELRLAPGGRVEHEIEWWGPRPTGTWLIEAADVEYTWVRDA